MKWSLILLASSFTLFACDSPNSTFDSDAVVEDITTMLHEYHQAMNKDGLLAEVHYLDSSDQFFWVPPGADSKIGYEDVMEILTENSKHDPFMKFDWQQLHVEALSKELAVYTGTVRFETVNEHGDQFVSHILETGTLIKRFDGWKLLCGQSRTVIIP